jgi:exosortase
VENVLTPQKSAEAAPLSRERFPLAFALSVLFLAALWFGLCRELSGEWSVNEQYNFGWFVPFFALYLFWLRWQDRPQIEIRSPKSETRKRQTIAALLAIPALLLLLPVRLFEIANPEWRLLAWIHAFAVVTLTLLLLWSVGGRAWLHHFAFPVAFIFIAVPWPTALEIPVIQGLMRIVAHVAAETAMLLGTPAQVEGNLIRVSNGLVGVNEACSGIRSLQTSLMIGVLFGEVKRLSVLRRLTLIVCASVIAILANFLRAVFLVRIAATENLSEVSRWHDVAGYSIILFVFVTTMALAHLLGKFEIRSRKSEIKREGSQSASGTPQSAIPIVYMAVALCWLMFVEIGTATWYHRHERNLVSCIRWSVHWPQQAANFRKLKIDNEIRAVLRFDEGDAAGWTISSPVNATEPKIVSCSLYVFRWNPGKNSALLANLHRPDVCLPASGWTEVADHGVRSYPISSSVELPFRHFEFQRAFENSTPQTAHAFYCLSEDRAVAISAPLPTSLPSMTGNRSEWTRTERVGAVLEGRRHLGQQVIEAIFISSEPFSAADAESQLRDLVREVVVLREPEK